MAMNRFKWESTPLINVLSYATTGTYKELVDSYFDETMKMHNTLRPPVGSLKERLGKQSFTWNGEYRFWVWEGVDWRVFASDKQGVSFEVREGLTSEQAFAAWSDFKRRVGIS